jgi:hypothetical protein
VDVLCIFLYDVDSSNAGIGLRFASFGWNPRWWLELDCLAIPGFDWFEAPSFWAYLLLKMLLIYPKFGLNPSSGLGDPSIGSWS